MKTEYEVKVLDIDVAAIEKKLATIGATHIGEKKQRRYVYDFTPVKPNSWIRLRTDGTKTTLTIKEIQEETISGAKELEIEVSSFEETHLLLNKLGYTHKGYEENKRSSYVLDGVEIEIDTWPRIPTYLEIDGKDEESVRAIVEKLGYSMSDTTSMRVLNVFSHYGINLREIPDLRF